MNSVARAGSLFSSFALGSVARAGTFFLILAPGGAVLIWGREETSAPHGEPRAREFLAHRKQTLERIGAHFLPMESAQKQYEAAKQLTNLLDMDGTMQGWCDQHRVAAFHAHRAGPTDRATVPSVRDEPVACRAVRRAHVREAV